MNAAAKEDRLEDLHVLLVDDDAAFLDLLEALLQHLGVKAITRAISGRDAFSKLHHVERVVDCVLCDYSMAEGNGLQLLQAIRTAKIKLFRPDACFILVTASGDHEVVGMAARLDVSGYLVKPVTPDKLKATILKARHRGIKIDFNRYMQVPVPG
ncbi:MAG: response regulator [Rhodospirillaceae bacterium]|nr:response regulator [Rhodospirillaceae bacterium]